MTNTATINAFWIYKRGDDEQNAKRTPSFATMDKVFDTEADRDAFMAIFPKWVGVKAKTRSSAAWTGNRPSVGWRADFRSTKGNECNEAGIKRFRKLVELGGDEIEFEAVQEAANTFLTLEETLTALAATA